MPISTGGTFTTGTSQSALLINRQYQVNDTLSAVHGRHQSSSAPMSCCAHTGGNSKEFGGPIYLGQFVYKPARRRLRSAKARLSGQHRQRGQTYTQSYGNANYTVNDTLWSLFVQDDFHVRPDLTLNLGLRYEQQTFTDSRKDFAPRVGFAYNWHGDGKTVIRGGFGIYYSQIVDNSAANYALTGPTGVFNYTRRAGPDRIPHQRRGRAAAGLSRPAPQAPLRSLYIRPGDSANLNQFFPTSTLIGYQEKLLNPYSEQWTIGVERRLRARTGC